MAIKTIHVVAIAQGFYEFLRERGERFDFTYDDEQEGAGIGDWMREADKDGNVVQTKEEKKAKVAAPVIPSAPFQPPAQTYKVAHKPVGNFIVVDAEGNQVGEVFERDPKDKAAAKLAAQAAADGMNQGSGLIQPVSPAQAALAVHTQTALSQTPELNADVNDADLPDA